MLKGHQPRLICASIRITPLDLQQISFRPIRSFSALMNPQTPQRFLADDSDRCYCEKSKDLKTTSPLPFLSTRSVICIALSTINKLDVSLPTLFPL